MKTKRRKSHRGGGLQAIIGNLAQHRLASVVIVVVVVLAVGGLFDFAANNGKAYGGVSVSGVDVGGLTEEEILDKLETTFGTRLANSKITLMGERPESASDVSGEEASQSQDETNTVGEATDQEADDTTEGDVDASSEENLIWEATQATTGASIPFEDYAKAAFEVGREDGGFLGRFGLFLGGRDIPITVAFDEPTLDALMKSVDETIGDLRVDATVVVEDGVAHAVEGHDGTMVDREWIEKELSRRMISDEENVSELVVEATEAPSRVTLEQAEQASEKVNKAIADGATFTYGTSSWEATRADIGSWVTAKTSGEAPHYTIELGIDPDTSTDQIVMNLDTKVTADDITISFEKQDSDILVHTQGETPIPDVASAVIELEEKLFGEQGKAATGSGAISVEVNDSAAPESLTFTQAYDLGIVSVLAEYTTEYSNEEGAENRNHNIHLVSDTLNDSIITANGGVWSFNETSGDTNQDPPYASAGSIVGGEYVDSIGGGICQVATTVFNAAYEAGIDIPLRYNHSYYLANYPDGRDASVSYPELDLQISNPLESDVLLKLSYTDNSVTATLYGVATGYQVSTEPGLWEEGEEYSTKFEHDDTLSEGMYYLKNYGSDGSKYSVTRTVNDAEGNLVSVKTFTSVYQPHDEVYVVGPGVDTSKLERDTDSTSDAYGTTTDSTGYYWDDQYGTGTDLYGTGTDIYGTGTDVYTYDYGTTDTTDIYGTTIDYGYGTDSGYETGY